MIPPSAPAAAAIVLAGGASRRLGQDKRRLRLWGEAGPTLLERTVALVSALCAEVIVVLNDPVAWPMLPARLVPDPLPGAGPLAALESGLAATAHERAVVVAADMPFLNATLLRAMLAHPQEGALALPAAPSQRNPLGVEPLHAIYRATCRAPIREAIAHGETRLTAFYPAICWATLAPEVWRRYDPASRSAFSINTPEDLAVTLQLMV